MCLLFLLSLVSDLLLVDSCKSHLPLGIVQLGLAVYNVNFKSYFHPTNRALGYVGVEMHAFRPALALPLAANIRCGCSVLGPWGVGIPEPP